MNKEPNTFCVSSLYSLEINIRNEKGPNNNKPLPVK